MKPIAAVASILLSCCMPSLAAVTFDWAYVGNAGNAPDTLTGIGSVAYDYAISTTEVTNAQYVEFLNAVDPTGSNQLRLYSFYFNDRLRGIEQTGEADGARYVAKPGWEQLPVTYVPYISAMRFVNWLHNGQGSGGTETGAYTIGSGLDEVRSATARYWIPSEDEWYKAAFHDASVGLGGSYFYYATGSNDAPRSAPPDEDPAGANYYSLDGIAGGTFNGYALSGTTRPPEVIFSDAGAYYNAASPYGTFDQSGNAAEWTEALSGDDERVFRGGSAGSRFQGIWSRRRDSFRPDAFPGAIGLRVATVPEPTSAALALIAVAGVATRRRR